jgi:hypothetical protein
MTGHRDSDSRSDSGSLPQPDGAADEGFLQRWSRLKRENREEGTVAGSAPGPEAAAGQPASDASGSAAASDAAESAESAESADAVGPDPELPPLESLGEDSDYSAFLAPGVCPDLRKAALRRLFHSPKFNVRCPLDDNSRDFREFIPLGDIVTSDMKHQALRRLEQLAEAADRAEAASPDAAPETPGPASAAVADGEDA